MKWFRKIQNRNCLFVPRSAGGALLCLFLALSYFLPVKSLAQDSSSAASGRVAPPAEDLTLSSQQEIQVLDSIDGQSNTKAAAAGALPGILPASARTHGLKRVDLKGRGLSFLGSGARRRAGLGL